jgi:hypothetical protein
MYRLTKLAPDGHFARDGSQPNEYDRANSLSLCQFNLEGWIHAASIVEAMRYANCERLRIHPMERVGNIPIRS